MFVIGVDGGGTRTIGALADPDGCIRAVAVRGPSNYHEVGIQQVTAVLADVLQVLLTRSNVRRMEISSACFGLAGAGREEDQRVLLDALKKLELPQIPLIVSDAMAALVGGTLSDTGILIIAGTGSIAYAKAEDGAIARAGGYGPLLSDEGSGYAVGRDGLRAVMRALDGREETSLRATPMDSLRAKKTADVIAWAREAGREKRNVADLAPLVLKEAEAGDQSANLIVKAAAADLALLAKTVYRKAGFSSEGTEVVLAGGLLEKSEHYLTEVRRALAQAVPGAEFFRPRLPAFAGALLFALAQAGTPVTGETLANLIRSQGKVVEAETASPA